MLVLFNTAYRLGYLKNVLRTIYLPCGALNSYRYTIGEDLQISEAEAKNLQALKSSQVLICFGDRYAAGGYEFHPLRKGVLIDVEISGGRAYFKVELGKHVSCGSVADFTKQLYDVDVIAKTGMLRLTNGDPLSARDGRYAIQFNDQEVLPWIESNEHSWTEAVRGLTKTKAFSDPDIKFVFAKCDLVVNGVSRGYHSEGKNAWYDTERDDDLRLSIAYVFPTQSADRSASAKMVVTAPPGLQLLSSEEHMLDMQENKIDIPFAFDGEKRFFTLDVKFAPASTNAENVIGPNEAVAIKVSDTGWKKLIALAFVAVYVAGAMCSTADNYKALGEFLKGAGLVGIFLALGSKKIV